MAVGGLVALILDNVLPGTEKDRGIIKWRSLMMEQRRGTTASHHVYDLPFGLTNKRKFTKFVPFLPYYGPKSTVSNEMQSLHEKKTYV